MEELLQATGKECFHAMPAARTLTLQDYLPRSFWKLSNMQILWPTGKVQNRCRCDPEYYQRNLIACRYKFANQNYKLPHEHHHPAAVGGELASTCLFLVRMPLASPDAYCDTELGLVKLERQRRLKLVRSTNLMHRSLKSLTRQVFLGFYLPIIADTMLIDHRPSSIECRPSPCCSMDNNFPLSTRYEPRKCKMQPIMLLYRSVSRNLKNGMNKVMRSQPRHPSCMLLWPGIKKFWINRITSENLASSGDHFRRYRGRKYLILPLDVNIASILIRSESPRRSSMCHGSALIRLSRLLRLL